MSDNGYVYSYRRSWSNPIFKNLKEAAVWNFLYQNAFWEDGERYYNNTKFNLKRGQIVLSISFLCKGFDMTDKEIRLLLDKLKRASMVAIKGANKGTIVTICNYDKYQRLEKTEGQAKGKQKGDNNNEVNEVNEGMKDNIGKFKKPTVDEISKYCKERKNQVSADKFFDYYESNGWKVGKNSMKDWKAAVRNWEKANQSNKKGTLSNYSNQYGDAPL